MKKSTLVLVRHGQSEWNKKNLNEVEEISTRTGQAEKELILRNGSLIQKVLNLKLKI